MATPRLRFKDFGEDWTAKKLSQVANLTSSKRVHLSDYVSEGIPFFRGKEITELKSGIFPKDILYISKKQYEDFKEKFGAPQNNEILMTAVGTLANTYLINTDFEFYFKDGNLIWFKDINADPNFLMILLDARKNDVLASAIGSTQKALTIANLNKLIFNFPSNEEQTKIASFLSAVDEKISQLTQKHQLLSQYKQGMMQKLFSQQIRFKADDGSEFGEWRKAKVGNITETIFGYPFDSKEMVEDNNGIPLMRGINIGECHIRHSFELDRFFLKDTSKLEKYFVRVNDIVLSMDGSKVGRNSAFVTEKDAGSLLVQRVCILREKENTNIQYVYQWIISKEFHRYVDQVKTSSGIPHISGKQIQDYEISYPCLEEQTKIANFLSAIDRKIEVVAQQIEQAKQWKKGLLQQMFV